MDMGSSSSNSTSSSSMSNSSSSCSVSMLWNWETVNACFISTQWHIRTVGAYAGTIVALFFLVILVELVRRLAREYDRKIIRDFNARMQENDSTDKFPGLAGKVPFRPTVMQQLIRSLFYFVQFGAGYMLMLLAMYYNGGIIFTIWIGAFAGFFLTSWDTLGNGEVLSKDCCC
ncbi:Ctr-domain-containing protein [Fistulina hepatica ATCC 64428]|uniref:Copper transport protein n=1 Tax=Fistulina hepatica ATCC 64428 TaxID=1128425 RepID=A0A0D7A7Z7_9AGAR|nr:Ctr-domain-containing protein [Fistulina hepatica ATCC 64428]